MDSISSIPQRPIYTLPVQVMAAAVTAAAVAIILMQSLPTAGLIVLASVGGANLVAFVVASVAAGRYAKQAKEATRKRGAAEGVRPVVPTRVEPMGEGPIPELLASFESLIGDMLEAEAGTHKKSATEEKKALNEAIRILNVIIPPLLKDGNKPSQDKLLPRIISTYNFGNPELLEEYCALFDNTPYRTDPEANTQLIAKLIPPVTALIFQMIDLFMNLKDPDLENKMNHLFLELGTITCREDIAGSQADFDMLTSAQLWVKKEYGEEVYFVLPGDNQARFIREMTNRMVKDKETIQDAYPKFDPEKDLSLIEMPEGLPKGTKMIPCPFGESLVLNKPLRVKIPFKKPIEMPIIQLLQKFLSNPARIPFKDTLSSALLSALKPFISGEIKKQMLDNNVFKDKSDPEYNPAIDGLLNPFIESIMDSHLISFIVKGILLGDKFRAALKQTLKDTDWAEEIGTLSGDLDAVNKQFREKLDGFVHELNNNLA